MYFIYRYRVALSKGKSKIFYQIFECEINQDNGNLISCCRYRLLDKIADKKGESSSTFFILLIHLPRKSQKSDFVSFQESPWICYHVDELIPSKTSVALYRQVTTNKDTTLSRLFYSENEATLEIQFDAQPLASPGAKLRLDPLKDSDLCQPPNLCFRLHSYISTIVSQLKSSQSISGKINDIEKLIPKYPQSQGIAIYLLLQLLL